MPDDLENYVWSHRPRFDAVLDYISEVASSSRGTELKILEIGAHPFVFTREILDNFPAAEVYCIGAGDRPPEVKTFDESEVEIRYCNVEEDDWPFDENTFDVVTMMAIIEHLFDPLSALWEAQRVLRQDGTFLLTVPNAVSLFSRSHAIKGTNPYDGYPLESIYNRHNHEYTREEVKDLLPVAGLYPTDIQMLNQNRIWVLPRIVQYLSRFWPNLRDQIVLKAHKAEPIDRLPIVYRQGVTESTETHPILESR